MAGQDISDDVLDRARGALLGQAVGDALGTTVEFQRSDAIARAYPDGLRKLIGGGPFRLLPGQVTDDTELALALARSLIARGAFDDDAVAEGYRKWYRSGPFDVGRTTAQAFGTPGEPGPGLAARMRACASQTSQANGSLMRQSPLGVFGWRLDEIVLADLSCRDSTLSHPHIACQESCVAFTHAIAFAVRTGASAQDVSSETIRFMSSRPAPKKCGVLDALVDARTRPPAEFFDRMGWVLIAFQNAFFRMLHADSVEQGIVDTIQCGGDTDTNACIAGALLGATHGATTVPARWQQVLLACQSPRPRTYRCGDLLFLADSLVRIGAAQ